MNVLLPQPVAPEATDLLQRENCTITIAPNLKSETIAPLMKEADGVILRTGLEITRDMVAEADKLLVVARTGAGLDNVDLDAATKKGIIVTSNLSVNAISVVEHVIAMMLALSKKLFLLDKAVRNGNFAVRYQNLARDVNGKTLGLVGYGRIGSKLGNFCHETFGMQVIVFDPYVSGEAKKKSGKVITFVGLEELITMSDIISIHVPLTGQTHHLLGTSELSRMKPDAILINTSRGAVVDEAALVETLANQRIAGAALDVFTEEPVSPDNPLLKLENVILTPHTAALTQECVIRMAKEAARCVLDVFNGREPPNVANREVLANDRWKNLIRSKLQ
jgi:D-3-phosphoglycerate dehydrogenase